MKKKKKVLDLRIPSLIVAEAAQVASGKWHGNYGVPVPETGRTSSSELIKKRAELNESDIRVNKKKQKMGRTNPAGKNSSGRSPLTDERIALQAAI
ncbi:hypothetical protein TNCV_2316301 [Trichonephila clavipes]|nr:hypothetical protein TNCV_2316301 [Trichonephila clavipes]